jgi:hypothetical protein
VAALTHDDLSGRRGELAGAAIDIDFIGRTVVERLVAASLIVEREVIGKPLSCLAAVPVGVQVIGWREAAMPCATRLPEGLSKCGRGRAGHRRLL